MKKQVKRMEEAIIPGYKLTEDEVKFLEELYVLLELKTCQRSPSILPITVVACRYQPMNNKFIQ